MVGTRRAMCMRVTQGNERLRRGDLQDPVAEH